MENDNAVESNNEKVERELSILRQCELTNLLLLVMVVVTASVFTYVLFLWEPSGGSAWKEYSQAAMDEIRQNSDLLAEQGIDILGQTTPIVVDALEDQIVADGPRLMKLASEEGLAVAEELVPMFEVAIENQLDDYLVIHHSVLREKFPDLAGFSAMQRLSDRYRQTITKVSKRFYVEEYRNELQRFQKAWAKTEPAPQPRPDEKSLEAQLANYLTDWSLLTLNRSVLDRGF